MKQLMVALFAATILVSCYSKALTDKTYVENYISRPISADSAEIYKKNYRDNPKFKAYFRRGMVIPMKVIDAIRTDNGIDAISVSYGKSPEFKSPVFIVTGTSSNLKYKASETRNSPYSTTTYIVYFPCPEVCGN